MRRVGRHALITRLGSGSLGDVFLAREEPTGPESGGAIRFDNRAVKLFLPALLGDLRFARTLMAGAPAATAFRHPVSVPVREIERDANDAWVVMDLEAGQPLSLVLKRAQVDGDPLDQRIVAWIGAQVASALHAAHQIPWFAGAPAPMIHGAISPRSVLLTYDGRVRLLGLGIGRARLCMPAPLGRLPYVAPELLQEREPSPRTDVYSLGVLLYEALSGRPIFRRATEDDTKAAVLQANAPRLNARTLRIDPDLGDLIADMMAPRIDARPGDLEEIGARLTEGADASPDELSVLLARRLRTLFADDLDGFQRMLDAAGRAANAATVTLDVGVAEDAAAPVEPEEAPSVEPARSPAIRPEPAGPEPRIPAAVSIDTPARAEPLSATSKDAPPRAPASMDAPAHAEPRAPAGLDAPPRASAGLDAPPRAPAGLDASPRAETRAPSGLDAPAHAEPRAPAGMDAPSRASAAMEAPSRADPRALGAVSILPPARAPADVQKEAGALPASRVPAAVSIDSPAEPSVLRAAPISLVGSPSPSPSGGVGSESTHEKAVAPERVPSDLVRPDVAWASSISDGDDDDDTATAELPSWASFPSAPAPVPVGVGLFDDLHIEDPVMFRNAPAPAAEETTAEDASPRASGEWSGDLDGSPDGATTIPDTLSPLARLDPRSTLEAPTPVDARRTRPVLPAENATVDLAQLSRVGRYRIDRVVERSATTVSFSARDPNLDRRVRVEVMDPAAITDSRLDRAEWLRLFKRKARLTASVVHTGLPVLLDAGRDQGLYFMAFAEREGELVSTLLGRGVRTSQSRVRRILVDLCDALHHLHENGIVCCDLRASTVLVSPGGQGSIAELSMAGPTNGREHPLLARNLLVLSPEYLDGHGYGPKSDQFALGVLLHQMLIGTRPFRGADDAELTEAIRTMPARPPETIEASVNPILSEVCMRLLEKDPALRYPSCGALADDLRTSRLGRTRRAWESTEEGERPPAPVPSIDSGALGRAYAALCERILSISEPMYDGDRDQPTAAARAVAVNLGGSPDVEHGAVLTVAIRDLASRLRMTWTSEALRPFVPSELRPLLEEVAKATDENRSDAPMPSMTAQIVLAVEAFFARVRPLDGRPRGTPRRGVAALRELAGLRFDPRVVEAMIEFLRESTSTLDLIPPSSGAARILIAGRARSEALVQALEFDGYSVEEAENGHVAWEKLRHQGYRGAIVDATLPGRDAVSLLRLARAHPDTQSVVFLVLAPQASDPLRAEVARWGHAEVMEQTLAVEAIRVRIGRLLG